MAWITKDSANNTVERRMEPYLKDAMKKRLTDEILPRYENIKGALLPCLHEIQHEYGWVPPQAMLEIAEFLDLPAADVLDTASFYEEYWLKPKGEHIVSVCRSIACEFCGQRELSEAIKAHLDIDIGETTEDNAFTLVELECIGACGGAPAMLVNETLYETVSPDRAREILDQTRAGKQPESNAYSPLTIKGESHGH